MFFPFQLRCSFSFMFQTSFMTGTVQAQSIGESKAKDSHRSPLLCGLLCLLPHQLRNYGNMTCVIRPCPPQSTWFRTGVWHRCEDIWHKSSSTELVFESFRDPMRRISPNDVVTNCRLSLEGRLKTCARNYHTSENPKVNVCNFETSNCFKIFQNYANCLNAMNGLQFWRCNMAYLPAPFSSFLALMSPHIQQVCLRQRLTLRFHEWIQSRWTRQSSKYASICHKMQ